MRNYSDGGKLLIQEAAKAGMELDGVENRPNMVFASVTLPHKYLVKPLTGVITFSNLVIGEVRNSSCRLPFIKASVLIHGVTGLPDARPLLDFMNAERLIFGKVSLVENSIYFEQTLILDEDGNTSNLVIEKLIMIVLDSALQIRSMVAENQSCFFVE